jgi:hypothetical protein
VFFKALFAGSEKTFLSLLAPVAPAEGTPTHLSVLVEHCIGLELRARRIYIAFANAFADDLRASDFFRTLAKQEQTHADLLAVCRVAAQRVGWSANCTNPWEEYIPHLEKHFDEIEDSLHSVGSLEDALQRVVQIETGEINRVFQAALASCDAAFISRLGVFRRAVETHVTYLTDQLPKLDPRFIASSNTLRKLFPR